MKTTTKKPDPTKPVITVCNAVIERVNIGISPDGTPNVHIVFYNSKELKKDVDECYRCASIPTSDGVRSRAEYVGEMVFRMSWLLDVCFDLNQAVGQVIRVELDRGHVNAIGHAIHERWLGYGHPLPTSVYPFYTGVPDAAAKH